jgi:hypothetical protein
MKYITNLFKKIFLIEEDPKGDNGHFAFGRPDKELISQIWRNPTSVNIHKIVELELQRRLTNRLYRASVFAIIAASFFGIAQIICALLK